MDTYWIKRKTVTIEYLYCPAAQHHPLAGTQLLTYQDKFPAKV